jgi:hypothetical protein
MAELYGVCDDVCAVSMSSFIDGIVEVKRRCFVIANTPEIEDIRGLKYPLCVGSVSFSEPNPFHMIGQITTISITIATK